MQCCGDVSCLHIPVNKESIQPKDEGITMVQQENSLQISSFANQMQ